MGILVEKFGKKNQRKKILFNLSYSVEAFGIIHHPPISLFLKSRHRQWNGFEWHMKWAARWEGFQYSIFPDGRGNDEYKLTHLHFWVCAPYDLLQSLPYFIFFISGVGKLKKAARNGKVTFGFRVWKICKFWRDWKLFVTLKPWNWEEWAMKKGKSILEVKWQSILPSRELYATAMH